jgi:hypothetical protein
MLHFLSQDTTSEWCVIKIFYNFSLKIYTNLSLLQISCHYISSVTVSSSNRHPVCAGCLLSRQVLLGHLDPWRRDRFLTPKRWNRITTLCCVQSQKTASLKTCSISVCPSIRMQNGGIYMCSVTLLQKMSTVVKSDYLPGQAIGPALSTQHLCCRFKSFFISKNHHTWSFQFLIAHKIHTHRSTSLL